MYYHGRGVGKDYEEAMKWYRKAAEQGYVLAQASLGALYYKGHGVPKDYGIAYAWVKVAVENEYPLAKTFLPIIAKQMTPDQITKAEELSEEMVKRNPKLAQEKD